MEKSGIEPGSVALVTGAGSGIGRATAIRLAERGCKVICAGRRAPPLSALVRQLDAAVALKLDVTKAEDCRTVFDRLPASHRQIDILINNAGHEVGGRNRLDTGDIESFVRMVETNVIGLMRVAHAVLPAMIERGRGDVVNVGSIVGLRQRPLTNVYAATKAFVHSLTEGMRLDYADTDLRMIEVMPGATRTGFAATRVGGDAAAADKYYDSLPGVLDPDDLARAIVYALDQPRSVTVAQTLILPTRQPA